jgi:hypothetical protein
MDTSTVVMMAAAVVTLVVVDWKVASGAAGRRIERHRRSHPC